MTEKEIQDMKIWEYCINAMNVKAKEIEEQSNGRLKLKWELIPCAE